MSAGSARSRRRSRSRGALVLLAALALAAGCGGDSGGGGVPPGPEVRPADAEAGARDGRPNVIVIVTDDQERGTITEELMPNTVELLRRQGTRFENFIVSSPLCCPSRAIQLTGQYGHNNGVLANDPGYSLLDRKGDVLPAWLGEAGYRTAHVGKYLNGYRSFGSRPARIGPGWEVWYSMINDHYYEYNLSVQGKRVEVESDPDAYATHVLNDGVVELIERFAADGAPFYIQLDHIAPHSSSKVGGRCRNSALGAPEDERRFEDAPLPDPPSYDERQLADKPSFIRDLPPISRAERVKIETRYRCRIETLPAVDRGVEEIFEALDRTGELERTVVMLYSDNGFFLGEHRLTKSKGLPYEESIRVPFLIRLPETLEGAGRVPRVHRQVASIDIVPTILELAGAKPCLDGRCRTLDGRSMLPLLGQGGRYPRRRTILVELSQRAKLAGGTVACDYRGVRTPARDVVVEYTRILSERSGECERASELEHYDLRNDPFQLRNLIGRDGKPSPRQRRLLQRARELSRCAGIRGRDPRSHGRPFCE